MRAHQIQKVGTLNIYPCFAHPTFFLVIKLSADYNIDIDLGRRDGKKTIISISRFNYILYNGFRTGRLCSLCTFK